MRAAIFLLFLFFCSFCPADLWADNKKRTEIDFDLASGKKPLPPLVSYSSRLSFALQSESVINAFAGFEPDSKKSGETVTLLRLKKGNLLHEFIDFDENGYFEIWKEYVDDRLRADNKLDETNALVITRTLYESGGKIGEILKDEEKKGYYAERDLFQNGQIVKTLRDRNGDFLYEEQLHYYTGNPPPGQAAAQLTLAGKSGQCQNFYLAGFYSENQLDLELTSEALARLPVKNSMSDILHYKNILMAKGRAYPPSRFDFFSLLKKENGKNDFCLIMGNLSQQTNGLHLYFRLLGPGPMQNNFSADLFFSHAQYSQQTAAERLGQLFSTWQESQPKAGEQ